MKKMKMMNIVVIISIAAVFSITSLAFGQNVTWPPKPIAQQALSCATTFAAVYPMPRGYAEVYCAKAVDGKPTDVKKYTCAPSGSIQTCSPGGAVVNHFDIPSAKMQKVCAPACTSWK